MRWNGLLHSFKSQVWAFFFIFAHTHRHNMYTDTSSSLTSGLLLRTESGSHEPRTTPSQSSQMKWMIANKRHHCILLVLFGGRTEQVDCWSNKCVEYMSIAMDPCTHWSACYCNAHCVGAGKQKTVQSQCKSGRLLIDVWRICVILAFVLSPTVCLIIWWWLVCMQPLVDCLIHFVVDIHI